MFVFLIVAVLVETVEGGLYDVQSIGFAVSPHDATFLNTRTAKVNCKAEGAPMPSISWETSDGKAVGNITGIRRVNYDGSLEFPAFEAKSFVAAVHRAQYRCIAKSVLGRLQSAAIKINAVIGKLYSPHVFHETSFPGGFAVFECKLDADVVDQAHLISWSLNWQKN